MKKFLKAVLWILVIILVVGYISDASKMNDILFGKNESSTESSSELKSPNNEGLFVKEGLIMDEPSLVFNETTGVPSIRYTYTLTDEAQVNEKNLVLLVAKLENFDKVNESNFTYDYWVDMLEDNNLAYVLIDEIFLSDGKRSFLFECSEFKWLEDETNKTEWSYNKQVNWSLVGWIAEKREDESGITYYDYAEFEDEGNYRTNARTLAQIACDMLNKNAAGEKDYSKVQDDLLKIMNASVDYMYGAKNPSPANDSIYHFTPSKTEITLGINEKVKITGMIAPDANMPLFYKSEDETIARVDKQGYVYGTTTGKTTVKVYLNGESKEITVTVK